MAAKTAPSRGAENMRAWRATQDPRKFKDQQLRIKFGITLEQYDRMHADQGGVCALCQQPERVAGRDLAVDHCHDTGKVRGLLCGHCNRALGFMGHDIRTLLRAARYLWRNR